MRILMLNHNLIGRGSYLRCLHFARWLVRWGHTVDLISTSDQPTLRWQVSTVDGVRILLPPRLGGTGRHDGGYAPVDILSRLPRGLAGYDLVHAFEHRPNVLLPMLMSRLRRTPLVIDWSDWWTRGGITTDRRPFGWVDRMEAKFLEEGTKRLANRITLVSRSLRDRAVEIGLDPSILDLIPSGCDIERIRSCSRQECRRKLGLNEEGPVLGFCGFALWDFEFLVRSFHLVLQRFPQAWLLVAGEDKEGRITTLAREVLGESWRQLIFAGRFQPEELEVPLGAADIQLLPLPDSPANRARWPIKFGDYLASGRPMVVSDVGDTALYVSTAGIGRVSEPSVEGMAEAVCELLGQPEAWEAMGTRARKLAETELSWETQSRLLLETYEKCRQD